MGYFRPKVLDPKHAMFMLGATSNSGSVSEWRDGLLGAGILVKVEGSDKYGVTRHFMEGYVGRSIGYFKDEDMFRISFRRCIESGHKSWTNTWIDGGHCHTFLIPGLFIRPIKLEKGMYVGLESNPLFQKGYIFRHNGKFTPLQQKHSKAKQVMTGKEYRYNTVDEMEGIWYVLADKV